MRKEKCQFSMPQVEFLGFLIDVNNIDSTASKVKDVYSTSPPCFKNQAIFVIVTVAEHLHLQVLFCLVLQGIGHQWLSKDSAKLPTWFFFSHCHHLAFVGTTH